MIGLAVALSLALQAPAAAPVQDAWRSFEGAGASVELPPGVQVDESTNGQVYFLDLRRANLAEDEALSLLRVILIPNPTVTPEQALDLLSDATPHALEQEGSALRETTPHLAFVAGAERAGRRQHYANERGDTWEVELHTFTLGAQTAGVVSKLRVPHLEAERALHARMRSSLILREVQGNEPILARIGSVGIRLPAMHPLPIEWNGTHTVGTAQTRLAEGVLSLSAQNCRNERKAPQEAEIAFEEFVQSLRREAADSQGALALEAYAAGLIRAGDRILPFQRIAVRAQGRAHEILATVVRDGAWIVALQLSFAPAQSAAAEARFSELLSTLDLVHPEPAALQLAGRGLRWSLPAWARATVYPTPQFILQITTDHTSGADLPTLYFEWRNDYSAARHEEMHAAFRAKLFPDAEVTWSGEWSVPSPLGEAIFLLSVLGEQGARGLLATAARPWRDATLAVVLTLPHARNAVQAEEVLSRLLADAVELAPEERVRLSTGRAHLDLPDGDWLGWEVASAERREIAIAAPWGEWHLRFEAQGSDPLLGDSGLTLSARQSLADATRQRDGEWQTDGPEVSEVIELPGLGRAARVLQRMRGSEGAVFAEAIAVRVEGGELRLWLFATGEADAALRAQLATLLGAVGCDPPVE